MPLSDVVVKRAKPAGKPFKISDAGGLFLLVSPQGSKCWRYKYRFAGKEKVLALGLYPDVSLAEARARHGAARKLLADGQDPGEAKRAAKLELRRETENSFEILAREWWSVRKCRWVESHATATIRRLEAHLFPKLGHRPIKQVTAQEFLDALRVVEENESYELTHKLLSLGNRIFQYSMIVGRAERNPLVGMHEALLPVRTKHHAYFKDDELPDFLLKLGNYDGHPQTKLGIELVLLTMVRTTEARGALRKEIDLTKAQWVIPPERMKIKDRGPHIVPLSRQAVTVMRELLKLAGDSVYLFPNFSGRKPFMSENTMLYALYRLGYHSKATIHGFRATASTILNEHGFDEKCIERQLAHADGNEVRAAYDHSELLPGRAEMMQWWADYLDRAAKKSACHAGRGGRATISDRKVAAPS